MATFVSVIVTRLSNFTNVYNRYGNKQQKDPWVGLCGRRGAVRVHPPTPSPTPKNAPSASFFLANMPAPGWAKNAPACAYRGPRRSKNAPRGPQTAPPPPPVRALGASSPSSDLPLSYVFFWQTGVQVFHWEAVPCLILQFREPRTLCFPSNNLVVDPATIRTLLYTRQCKLP